MARASICSPVSWDDAKPVHQQPSRKEGFPEPATLFAAVFAAAFCELLGQCRHVLALGFPGLDRVLQVR